MAPAAAQVRAARPLQQAATSDRSETTESVRDSMRSVCSRSPITPRMELRAEVVPLEVRPCPPPRQPVGAPGPSPGQHHDPGSSREESRPHAPPPPIRPHLDRRSGRDSRRRTERGRAAARPCLRDSRDDTPLDVLRQWDGAVDSMNRNRELVVTSRLEDRTLPGAATSTSPRSSTAFPCSGVAWPASSTPLASRCRCSAPCTWASTVDTTPGLSAAEVADRLEQAQGGRLVASRRPALLVVPLPDGTHTLAYRVAMSDGRYYFVDADDGRLVHIADAFLRQSAVGGGSDSLGRQRKVSTTRDGSRYQAAIPQPNAVQKNRSTGSACHAATAASFLHPAPAVSTASCSGYAALPQRRALTPASTRRPVRTVHDP